MKHEGLLQKQNRILSNLSCLPKRMLALQNYDNIPEFVLHDLSHEHCFNFNKSAYFVDNADFNCLKGVAGVSRAEAYANGGSVWDSPKDFSVHMQSSPFNQKVRAIAQCSLKKGKGAEYELLQGIAQELGFCKHGVCSWGMKHDNNGILLYEKSDETDTVADGHLIDGLSLLGFCPIF